MHVLSSLANSFQLKHSDVANCKILPDHMAMWQYMASNNTDFSIQYHHPGTWYRSIPGIWYRPALT